MMELTVSYLDKNGPYLVRGHSLPAAVHRTYRSTRGHNDDIAESTTKHAQFLSRQLERVLNHRDRRVHLIQNNRRACVPRSSYQLERVRAVDTWISQSYQGFLRELDEQAAEQALEAQTKKRTFIRKKVRVCISFEHLAYTSGRIIVRFAQFRLRKPYHFLCVENLKKRDFVFHNGRHEVSHAVLRSY